MCCVWYWVSEDQICYERLFPRIHSLWWSKEKQANAPVFIFHFPLPKCFSAVSSSISCWYADIRLLDSPWRALRNGLEKIKIKKSLSHPCLWKISYFQCLVSLWSSLATLPWQIFHKSSNFSAESSPPFISPLDRSANLLFFQTCTRIHSMHVLGFRQNTKREKDRAESRMP